MSAAQSTRELKVLQDSYAPAEQLAFWSGTIPATYEGNLMSHTTPDNVTEYEPEEVQALLAEGKILLVDVREPMEYAAERIPGALLYPLSSFDASQLPPDGPRQVVFSCAAGGRSLTAARQRMALGQPAAHLAGGISQWKAEGLPVVRIDPRTGRPA